MNKRLRDCDHWCRHYPLCNVCIDWTCQSMAISKGYENCSCACKLYQKTAEEYLADCSCSSNNCLSFSCEPQWEDDDDYDLRRRILTDFSETRVLGSSEEAGAEWPGSGEGPTIGDRAAISPTDSSETADAGQSTEEPSNTSDETVRPRANRFSHEDVTAKKVAGDNVSKMDIGLPERSAHLTGDLLLMAECSCDCLVSANQEDASCDCGDSKCKSWDCHPQEVEEEERGRENQEIGEIPRIGCMHSCRCMCLFAADAL